MLKNSGKSFKLSGFAAKSHKENGIAITGEGAFESLRPASPASHHVLDEQVPIKIDPEVIDVSLAMEGIRLGMIWKWEVCE